ncbi:MAG: PilZ domain-containing protein [Methylococcales bacterium]|nr:PilZ domain-containing protein [Methylococcales bacterium]
MIQKKYFPRVETKIAAVIENEEGVHFNVVAVDASAEGVSIQCNTIKRNIITPGGRYISEGKPIELLVWLQLPFDDGQFETIGIRCHVTFSRRLSSHECQIGMRYSDFDQGAYETLLRYLQLS